MLGCFWSRRCARPWTGIVSWVGPNTRPAADRCRARKRDWDGVVECVSAGLRSSQGKIKLHFTQDRSLRRSTRSHEGHRLCGTSWSQPRCVARSVSPRVPSEMQPGCRRGAARGRIACRDSAPRPARESLPERAARALPRRHGNPPSGSLDGGLRESEAAALRRAPGNLGPGPYAGVRRDSISRGP